MATFIPNGVLVKTTCLDRNVVALCRSFQRRGHSTLLWHHTMPLEAQISAVEPWSLGIGHVGYPATPDSTSEAVFLALHLLEVAAYGWKVRFRIDNVPHHSEPIHIDPTDVAYWAELLEREQDVKARIF